MLIKKNGATCLPLPALLLHVRSALRQKLGLALLHRVRLALLVELCGALFADRVLTHLETDQPTFRQGI